MTTLAILLPDLRGGGAERVMLDLANELARHDTSVTFVLRNAQGELLEEAQSRFLIVDLGASRVRYAYAPLRRWIRLNRPDAILANLWPTGALALLAARGSGTRVIPVEHSVLSRQYAEWGRLTNFQLRLSIRHLYPLAHAVVAVSSGAGQDVEALGNLAPGTVRVIPNPVQRARVVPDRAIHEAASEWATGKGPLLLSVGNLKRVKNHALLLHAFAKLQAKCPARLLILGEGDLRGELKELAMSLGVAHALAMPGFRTDPAPFYKAADVFVLSSDHEGFGNVLVEAMSYGLPVVSTDCPSGPSEILDGGRFGRLVPVKDAEKLAAAIEAEIHSKRDANPLVERAKQYAPEHAAEMYLKLLTSLPT